MNHSIEKEIGQNIRVMRERCHLTQNEVAEKLQLLGCDITRSALAKIEVGQRHLYPDEIIFLCEVLRCQYSDILKIQKDHQNYVLDQ